jgi:WD40 repeat protein
VRLWDVSTQREVAVLQCNGRVRSVAFDGSGKYLASGEASGVTDDRRDDGKDVAAAAEICV